MEYLRVLSEYAGQNVTDIKLDGTFERFGKKKAMWVVGSIDASKGDIVWSMTYGDNRTDDRRSSFSENVKDFSPYKKKKLMEKMEEAQIRANADRQEKYKKSREIYGPIFKELKKGDTHAYLLKKKIDQNYTAKVVADNKFKENNLFSNTLCIPVYNAKGQVTGLQRIYEKGDKFEKRFTSGLELKGSICPIAPFKNAPLVYLAEGFATACSIHMALKLPVVACFNAGNIEKSIRTIRAINAHCKIVICADRDNAPNKDWDKIGERKSLRASKAHDNCIVKVVEFKENAPSIWSDFNDLHQFEGLDKVKDQLTLDPDNFQNEQFKSDISSGFTKQVDEKTVRQYHRLLDYYKHLEKIKYIAEWKRFVVWRDGYYQYIEEVEVMAFAQEYFNYPSCESNKERAEFVGLVKTSTIISSSFFNPDATNGLINLKNGVYNIKTRQLSPHSPDLPFQYILKVDYNPDAQSPVWNVLVHNLMTGRENIINVLHEYMGLVISNTDNSRFNEILIMFGAGSNGKSTIVNAIEALVGRQNSSAVSIEKLGRFGTGSMRNKLVNFSEEEGPKVFAETGMLKKISGGSPIDTEEKGKQSILTPLRCKLIMSYNEMPFLKDLSAGMLRRLLILPFDLDLDKEPKKKISNIKEHIDEELEGILLHALKGLERLLKQKGFTYYAERENSVRELVNSSDSFREFIEEEYKITGDQAKFVSTGSVLAKYSESMGLDYHARLTTKGAIKKLKSIFKERGVEFKAGRKMLGGTQNRGIFGLERLENID